MLVRVTASDLEDYLYVGEMLITGTSESGDRIAFCVTTKFIEEMEVQGEAQTEVGQSDIYQGLYPCPGNASAIEEWVAGQGHGDWCNEWVHCDDPSAHEQE